MPDTHAAPRAGRRRGILGRDAHRTSEGHARRRSILRAARAIAPLAVLAAALPSAATAQTGFSSCPAGHYLLVDPSGNPQVVNLQIRMAHRAPYSGLRTGAPKCLVAEAVAGLVQARAASGPPPRAVVAQGARWAVGRFTCTYRTLGARPVEAIRRARCVHTGRFAATVRFVLRGSA
jgi:hypothetical protein